MNRVMKDSGIEWIGEIPLEWMVSKVGFEFGIIGSGTTPMSSLGSFYDGDYFWLQTGDLNDSIIEYTEKRITELAVEKYSILKQYSTGSLAIAMYGATIGKIGILGIPCYTNQACCVLDSPKRINTKYVYYWFLCNRPNLINLSLGGGQQNINQNTIKDFKLCVPPQEEQVKIVSFLDEKCAEIDSLIAAKEKINTLLKDWRQSIIYEAVTKGLDPNVPLKNSGIEWIGEIPRNWNVERLKYHACFNPNTDLPDLSDNDVVSFVPMDRLKTGFHLQAESVYSRVKKGYVVFKEEDILMAKVTPCLENGNLAIASNLINGIGFGSTEINVIRCFSISNKYLFYLLQCPSYIEKASYNMFGVAGLKRLDPKFIPYSFFPFPPHEDQLRISEYLDNKCAEIDIAIKINNTSIQKLKQYRQSLIYEAVTGKIEV